VEFICDLIIRLLCKHAIFINSHTEIILETRRKCNRSGLERQPSLLLLFFSTFIPFKACSFGLYIKGTCIWARDSQSNEYNVF